MASANLELVRSIMAAWDRGDFAAADWAHPNIEYVEGDGPGAGKWTGRPAMAAAWRDVLNAWEDFRVYADQYIELDHERVLVLTSFGGHGRTSGLDIGRVLSKGAAVFHIHNDQVVRFVGYFDRDRALAELGLTPEQS